MWGGRKQRAWSPLSPSGQASFSSPVKAWVLRRRPPFPHRLLVAEGHRRTEAAAPWPPGASPGVCWQRLVLGPGGSLLSPRQPNPKGSSLAYLARPQEGEAPWWRGRRAHCSWLTPAEGLREAQEMSIRLRPRQNRTVTQSAVQQEALPSPLQACWG